MVLCVLIGKFLVFWAAVGINSSGGRGAGEFEKFEGDLVGAGGFGLVLVGS